MANERNNQSNLSGFDMLMGITFDDDNNMYFVEQTVFFANSEVHKYTWNGTTWVATGTVADNSFDTPPSGFTMLGHYLVKYR